VSTHLGQHITDDMIAALRQRLGVERPIPSPYNTEASGDAIRHFAHGIGDLNPLWQDPDYAARTRWGGIIAPPCFLFSCGFGRTGGLPGVHGLFAGSAWTFFRPVRVGTPIQATVRLVEVQEKTGAFAGRQVLQIDESIYRDSTGELLATVRNPVMRTERQTAQHRGKYASITPHAWTPEELAAIDAELAGQQPRGATPRYWEDVMVGEELTPLLKGPLTVTDCIGWLMGWGSPFVRPHLVGAAYRRRHPSAYIPNALGVPDIPERVHWDDAFARAIGAPAAYDYGPQRVSWLGHLLSNWLGDDGWLQTLDVQVRRFNIMGDLTRCKGVVTGKRLVSGQCLIDCDVWAENQRGETTAWGTATAVLPSRKALAPTPSPPGRGQG
jgi:acyl dehydratase